MRSPLALVLLATAAAVGRAAPAVSSASDDCITCHESVSPGIVEDWKLSRHARVTPAEALRVPELSRRMSAKAAPEGMNDVVVGCFECHGQSPDAHADTFEHFGHRIHVVVTPSDCKSCHPVEAEEYGRSKKAHAAVNLEKNPLYHTLVDTVTTVPRRGADGRVVMAPSPHAQNGTCFACHGSRVEVTGMRTVKTDLEDIQVPVLSNWPNQGVGRINPDGSMGACTACHPRHSFSIEIARKPYTCQQCHLQPDVPAWDVYIESKHGNIFETLEDDFDWDEVPWRVGKDFQAPTCATCHNSLLASPSGEVIAPRTHDFGARLWVRLFGLPYSHPQPRSGATYTISNPEGGTLPTTFSGELATEHLIDPDEQARRRAAMARLCQSCHGSSWVGGHLDHLDRTLEDTDATIRAATDVMRKLWDAGAADPANPFDEPLEREWMEMWLFYANSVRYAAAMGGPDYAGFKNGWWELTKGLAELEEALALHEAKGRTGKRRK